MAKYHSRPSYSLFPKVDITVARGKIARAHLEQLSGSYDVNRGDELFDTTVSQCLYAMCGQNIEEFRKLMNEIRYTDQKYYSMGLKELDSRKQREIQEVENKYKL